MQQQQQQPMSNRSSQSNYVFHPRNPHQKALQKRSLPAYFADSQMRKIIERMSGEENSDSIRMLIFLENGEQRLIAFTLPQGACTIKDILEQVHVPFQADTQIQVTETNYDGIHYIVTVGNVTNVVIPDDDTAQASIKEDRTMVRNRQTPSPVMATF